MSDAPSCPTEQALIADDDRANESWSSGTATRTWFAVLTLLSPVLGAIGCGVSEGSVLPSTPNVRQLLGVRRPDPVSVHGLSVTEAEQLQGHLQGERFYLALHRSQLGRVWFLSAALTQVLPGRSSTVSLGTHLVTFREESGAIVMRGTRGSPTGVALEEDGSAEVERSPIIERPSAFEEVPHAADYVLFDPAAGVSELTMVTEPTSAPVPVDPAVSVIRRFREGERGSVRFERVIVGRFTGPDGARALIGGVVDVTLSPYDEGPGFERLPLPEPAHFIDAWGGQPEGPAGARSAAKWNTRPGMAPIKWWISDEVIRFQQAAPPDELDVVGAIQRGIEHWNEAFGFEVFRPQVRRFDEGLDEGPVAALGPTLRFDATGAPRNSDPRLELNPRTGEVRAATVAISAEWVALARALVSSPEDPTLLPELNRLADLPAPTLPTLRWAGFEPTPLCDHTIQAAARAALRARVLPSPRPRAMTRREHAERFLTHVVLHRVGHVLGLRHNLKGSLVPPTSSVMDLLEDRDAVLLDYPQRYDIAAIRYLYGLGGELPAQPFCADEQVSTTDAHCQRFDRSSDPLGQEVGPQYREAAIAQLKGVLPVFDRHRDSLLDDLARFAWLPARPSQQAEAVAMALTGVGIPIDHSQEVTYPGYVARADALARHALDRLSRPPGGRRITESSVHQLIASRAKGVLLNEDAARSIESRKAMVAVLEHLASPAGRAALDSSREPLAVQLSQATGSLRLALQELQGRIDEALKGYVLDP